jgi:nucleotide-binding universal stress UspA family protein
MSGSAFAWVTLAIWLIGGLAGYYYLYRHGHPSPVWLLAGLVLGPFSLLVFMDRVEPSSHVLVEQPGTATADMTVVVGLDGSAVSREALAVAERLMEPRHHLVLCEVVDYDAETDPSGQAVAAATKRLQQTADTLPGDNVTVEVLAGRPAQALDEAAETHDADVIVVGTRGRGLSQRLLGSVSEDLLASSKRPVLVVHRRDE